MAQIETFSGNHADLKTWLIAKLISMHSFVKIVSDEDLYFTDSSYITITHVQEASLFTISVATPGGTRSVYTYNYYGDYCAAAIIKTAKNDILVKISGDSDVANAASIFTLAQCRNGMTGEELWAVYSFKRDASIGYTWNPIGYVFTDDTCSITLDIDGLTCNKIRVTSATGYNDILTGYNGLAGMTVLIPVCSVSSCYIGKTTYMILFTPQYYDGPVVINGKRYYACNHLFMLDE